MTAAVSVIMRISTGVLGLALLGSDTYTVIRFVVSILALIIAVFAWQAKHWWWIIPFVAIAVLWNPVLPIDVASADLWLGLQYIAVVIFMSAGILIRVADKS